MFRILTKIIRYIPDLLERRRQRLIAEEVEHQRLWEKNKQELADSFWEGIFNSLNGK
jgi:hypothetical protein